MKRKGFLQTACTMATALLLLAACTQDELADKQGEPLPEGKYPLTFTASIGGETVAATPQTRASADGDATSLDYIGTWVLNDQTQKERTMIFKRDGATSTWKYDKNIANNDPATAPYYWGSTSESISMGAWYFPANKMGEAYKNQVYNDFFWEVAVDQSKDNGYENSDFLYAFEWLEFSGSKTLHFFHQTAKVVVHIIAGDQTPADISGDKIGMTIGTTDSKVSVSGRWEAPPHHWMDDSSTILGYWDTGTGTQGIINPKALGQQEFTMNAKKYQSLASYEALVIPQTVEAGKKLFVINVEGYAPFYYTVPGGIEWSSGIEHTYYITIQGSSLSVTIRESYSWTDGGTGSGSVVLPELERCDQLGAGTAAEPYQLTNLAQLQDLSDRSQTEVKLLSAHYLLTKNITLPPVEDTASPSNWTPIGRQINFTGTFDGNGCTITGLTVSSDSRAGLFDWIDNLGTVKNLTLAACKIEGNFYVGGIAGRNLGTIENCHIVGGSVKGTVNFVGGITGENNGHILACSNAATVTGNSFVGGIAGVNIFWEGSLKSPAIISCYNAGSVTSGNLVGAIIGNLQECAPPTSCYYTDGPNNGYGMQISDATMAEAIVNMNTALPETSPYEWVVDQTTGQPVVRSK